MRRPLVVAGVGALAGAAVVLGSSVLGGSLELSLLFFIAWALVPYGLLLLAGRFVRNAWAVGGAGAVTLAAESGIRLGVFVFPRGSTSAIALVFSPILLSVVALPLGAACGWLFGRVWRASGRVVRALASVSASLLLGLLVLAFGRPELTPWEVMGRQAAWERIGEPRVVVGGDAFTRVPVSEASAWFQAAELDGKPGDEIAVMQHRVVTLLDPVGLQEVGRIELSSDPLLNWFSVLARLRERVVVVQTGGGYSETEVRETDGRMLWRHRPDPQLPPTALRPVDLDADGELEFYAAEGDSVARLDGAGQVVWRQPARYGSALLLSGPRTALQPAWVAAVDMATLTVWDETGRRIADRTLSGERGPTALAELGAERLVWTGSRTLRAESLLGEVRLELPLGDFSFGEAVSVLFSAEAPAHLAVAAAAPRDVKLWRLLIISPAGDVVYDEILDHAVHPFVAHRADGADTLLLSGQGLQVVQPVP